MSIERSDAVTAWRKEQYQTAYRYILAAFPQADKGKPDSGRIGAY